jgi:hypothetical protein
MVLTRAAPAATWSARWMNASTSVFTACSNTRPASAPSRAEFIS